MATDRMITNCSRRWLIFGSPCGGGVEYLHRNPASRRRRWKGKFWISDSKYGREPQGTRIREWLRWRVPAIGILSPYIHLYLGLAIEFFPLGFVTAISKISLPLTLRNQEIRVWSITVHWHRVVYQWFIPAFRLHGALVTETCFN
jgi:hypothetical protein